MKRFYVATKLERVEEQRAVVAALTAAGHELTYDWGVHGSVQTQPERWAEVSANEVLGVTSADAVIVLLPGGRGTHVELGIALGCGAKIIVVGADAKECNAPYTCVFYHHKRVTRVNGYEEFGGEYSVLVKRPLADVIADVIAVLR